MRFVAGLHFFHLLCYKNPGIRRPFRVPFLYLIAPLGIIFNVAMMLSLELENWIRLMAWLALGMLVYFFFSRKNSVLGKQRRQNNLTQRQ